MTQEEKAKAYDIALDKIKRLLGTGSNCSREDLEYVFPELAESEDERIRKHLIEIVELYYGYTDEQEKKDCLDWLEKQNLVIEMKTPEESLDIDSNTYSKIVDECVYGEQKSAWSEEDEKQARQIQRIVHDDGCTQKLQEQIADWLKSLKQRYTWKPSDEQIKALEHFVRSVGESGYAPPYDNNIKLLYSILSDLEKLIGDLRDDILRYINSVQEESVNEKKCMFTKDNYTDNDRKVLCADCDEKCEYSKKEEPVSESIDFEQELYKAFGQIKDFTLGIAIAKRFYDMGRKHKEPVSEELEEAAVEAFKEIVDDERNSFLEIFKAGADWKITKLMANATEVTVHIDAGGYPYIPQLELYDYDKDVPLAKEGDKYKVVLIKE